MSTPPSQGENCHAASQFFAPHAVLILQTPFHRNSQSLQALQTFSTFYYTHVVRTPTQVKTLHQLGIKTHVKIFLCTYRGQYVKSTVKELAQRGNYCKSMVERMTRYLLNISCRTHFYCINSIHNRRTLCMYMYMCVHVE